MNSNQSTDRSDFRGARTDMISAQILSCIIALGSRSTLSVIKCRSSGFATGRSTVNRILALSILAQTRKQFHQPLLIMRIAAIAYVEVAFDTVDRKISDQLLKQISLSEKIGSILAEWLVSHQVWRVVQRRI